MTLLSININKIALIRNAREGDNPNLWQFVQLLLEQNIKGITVHPRPDFRHIKVDDVKYLSQKLPPDIEFNIEGNPLYRESFKRIC